MHVLPCAHGYGYMCSSVHECDCLCMCVCVAKTLTLCTMAKQIWRQSHGGEGRRGFLTLLCKGEHSRLVPQELPPALGRGYSQAWGCDKEQGSNFCKVSKG